MNIKKIGCLLLAILFLNLGILNQAEAVIAPERIGGFTRYDTSVLICRSGWQESSDYAVIVSGQDFQSTLCAVPLAKKYKAPILLTPKDKLDNPMQWASLNKELYRLKVKKIFLIGGENSISSSIEHEFMNNEIETTRIDGKDKYDISFKIAEIVGMENGIVMVNEKNYSNSVTMSSVAASMGMPLVLVPNTIDNVFQKNIENISKYVSKAYVVGDSSLISDDIISKFNNSDRILGKDEYEVSVNVLEKFKNYINYDTVYLSSESDLADGLLGSVMAAMTSSPIILIQDKYDSRVQDYLRNKMNLIRKIKVLGGQGVISDSTLESILLVSKDQIINDSRLNTPMNEQEVNSIGKGVEHLEYKQPYESTRATGEQNEYTISLVNNSKINLTNKSGIGEEKNLGNTKKDVTIQVAGMDIQTKGWVTVGNSGIKEVVKIPDIVRPYLPKEVKEKQYIIMDPLAIVNNDDSSIPNFKDMVSFENNFQPEFENFLKKYSQEWNSGFDFITYKGLMRMDTELGVKYAKTYNLKITNVTFKSILDYTKGDFIQDKNFMAFVKQLLMTCIDLSKDENKDIQKKQLEDTFNFSCSHSEASADNIKNFINAIKDVNILGSNGIDITYNICDGYVVGESGTVDLNTGIVKLISTMNSISEKGEKMTADSIKSALETGFNFSVESYNKNANLEISLPEVTKANSIDYNELTRIYNNKKK